MMRTFLLLTLVVTALFFYLKDNNTNSEIDTIQNELNNRIEPQAKLSVVKQEKMVMTVSEVVSQVTTALLVKEELDIVMPSTNQPSNTPPVTLVSGIDEIGGYYDGSARSPESESQQYNEVVSLGIDTSDVLVPEMDFDDINIEGGSPSASQDAASSEPPEGSGN